MVFRDDRSRRDQAGVGPDPNYVAGELVRMGDLAEFRFSPGEPDIRGWEVCTLTGQQIGRVDELLVDPRRGEVVLLDVDMRDQPGHREVAIRAVQLDRAHNRVVVDRTEFHDVGRDLRHSLDEGRSQIRTESRDVLNRDIRSGSAFVEEDDVIVERKRRDLGDLIDDDDRIR